MQLFTKGRSIKQIAEQRQIKENTVWEHLARLIEYQQLSLTKALKPEKIRAILPHVYSENDKLQEIRERVQDETVTFNEIACVLASIKFQNKKRPIGKVVKWYQATYCFRKCSKEQRAQCATKFEQFTKLQSSLEIKKQEFLSLFNDHMAICVLPDEQKRAYVSWDAYLAKKDASSSRPQPVLSQQSRVLRLL